MATLLFIEPNVKVGRLYCEFLERAGFTTYRVRTCVQAIACLNQPPAPNMVIIDPLLSEECSALMGYLGNHEEFRHTQVVMMIGSENRQQGDEALGIHHFLYKPVALPMLLTFIRSVLAKSALQ